MPTKIAWAEEIWNPIKGCTKVSAGCRYCYAETFARRLAGAGVQGYDSANPFKVEFQRHVFDQPRRWRKPRVVFVCSMGDLFHTDVKDEWLDEIFQVMCDCLQHTFLVLTKRPSRMMAYLWGKESPTNVWFGTSVENEAASANVGWLRSLYASSKGHTFASYEPALGPVDWTSYLPNLGWLICGAESGPSARPFDDDWAIQARDQCKAAGVPFFWKQRGKQPGARRAPEFGTWPESFQVREYPDFRGGSHADANTTTE